METGQTLEIRATKFVHLYDNVGTGALPSCVEVRGRLCWSDPSERPEGYVSPTVTVAGAPVHPLGTYPNLVPVVLSDKRTGFIRLDELEQRCRA